MDDSAELIRKLLQHLDDDPTREGLRDTPARYQKFLEEFLHPEPLKPTTFKNEGYSEMIVQSRIPFYSICEHHLIPFFGYGTIAYIPDEKIIGLSKLARILDQVSRKLQNQERITTQVVDILTEAVQPKGVGVILQARHLCMEMRGIQKPETLTTTSALSGIFESDPQVRAAFLRLGETQAINTSTLHIEDLVIEAKHGVHEHEKHNAQRFNVSVELNIDLTKAMISDDLDDTLDWSALRDTITQTVQNNSFNLIERLARKVADDILLDKRIQNIIVHIDKLDAFKSGAPGITLEVQQTK